MYPEEDYTTVVETLAIYDCMVGIDEATIMNTIQPRESLKEVIQ